MKEVIERISLIEIFQYIGFLKKTNKGQYYSNYYNQYNSMQEIFFDVYKDEKTICFLLEDNGVCRLYFFTFDINSLSELIKKIRKKAIIEYIYKTDSSDINWDNIFCLKKIDSFKHYSVSLKDDMWKHNFNDSFYSKLLPTGGELAKITDCEEIQRCLSGIFDKRVAHLPSNEELKSLIASNSVFIYKQNSEIKCCTIFRREGKWIYSYQAFSFLPGLYLQSMWYHCIEKFVQEGYRGLHTWVSDGNMLSLKLHFKFNYKFDRMKLVIFEIDPDFS